MTIECKHGQLARSCNICALEAELAEVTAQRDKLQELINAPEVEPALVVEVEPDYWHRGHYCEGSKPHISPLKVWKLPVGTKLYTAPQPPKLSDERIYQVWGEQAEKTIGKSHSEFLVSFVRAIEREILGEK